MKHSDGTPYWTPAYTRRPPIILWSTLSGEAFTEGGNYLGEYDTLTECAEAFLGETINLSD